MKKIEKLLKEFVILELKKDYDFLKMLQRYTYNPSIATQYLRSVIVQWQAKTQAEIGRELTRSEKATTTRFATRNWGVTLRDANNDINNAKKLMMARLDAKYLSKYEAGIDADKEALKVKKTFLF